MHDRVESLILCLTEHEFGASHVRRLQTRSITGVERVDGGRVENGVATAERACDRRLVRHVALDELDVVGEAESREHGPCPLLRANEEP